MKALLKTAAMIGAVSMMSVQQAFAGGLCSWFPGLCSGGGTGNSVPEIDGPGGIAAMALLVSVVAVIYNRSRK